MIKSQCSKAKCKIDGHKPEMLLPSASMIIATKRRKITVKDVYSDVKSEDSLGVVSLDDTDDEENESNILEVG